MAIDVNTKINQLLLNIEQSNPRLVEVKYGEDEINEYLKRLLGSDNVVNFSVTPFKKLNIKDFGNFKILNMANQDSEVVILVKEKEMVLKMISILGISRYKNTCDGVTLLEERKNSFKDTDVYLNNEHIIKNRVMRDMYGNINAEIFSANYEADSKIQDFLYGMTSSLNVAYKNDLPSNMEIMWYHRPLDNKYVSNQLGVDIETSIGRSTVISEINAHIDVLLKELNDNIFDINEEIYYTKRK